MPDALGNPIPPVAQSELATSLPAKVPAHPTVTLAKMDYSTSPTNPVAAVDTPPAPEYTSETLYPAPTTPDTPAPHCADKPVTYHEDRKTHYSQQFQQLVLALLQHSHPH
jgi:hypothetical protein